VRPNMRVRAMRPWRASRRSSTPQGSRKYSKVLLISGGPDSPGTSSTSSLSSRMSLHPAVELEVVARRPHLQIQQEAFEAPIAVRYALFVDHHDLAAAGPAPPRDDRLAGREAAQPARLARVLLDEFTGLEPGRVHPKFIDRGVVGRVQGPGVNIAAQIIGHARADQPQDLAVGRAALGRGP